MKIYASTVNIWNAVRIAIIKEAQQTRNPLRNSSFFTTNAGYYLEQLMLDVEARCHVTAHSEGQFELFYETDSGGPAIAAIKYNSFWDAVLKIVRESYSPDAFERNYEMYLGTKLDQ